MSEHSISTSEEPTTPRRPSPVSKLFILMQVRLASWFGHLKVVLIVRRE